MAQTRIPKTQLDATLVDTTTAQAVSGKNLATGNTFPTFNQNTTGSAASLSATLAVASGGTGVTVSDPVIQRVGNQTGAVATGATIIPSDDTVPTSTEGDQYLSQTITPKNSANILKVEVILNLSHSASPNLQLIASLFNGGTSALAVAVTQQVVATGLMQLKIIYTMTAGTTSATTFTVRAGGSVSGTTTLNGQSGARMYGATLQSGITITEYAS